MPLPDCFALFALSYADDSRPEAQGEETFPSAFNSRFEAGMVGPVHHPFIQNAGQFNVAMVVRQ